MSLSCGPHIRLKIGLLVRLSCSPLTKTDRIQHVFIVIAEAIPCNTTLTLTSTVRHRNPGIQNCLIMDWSLNHDTKWLFGVWHYLGHLKPHFTPLNMLCECHARHFNKVARACWWGNNQAEFDLMHGGCGLQGEGAVKMNWWPRNSAACPGTQRCQLSATCRIMADHGGKNWPPMA